MSIVVCLFAGLSIYLYLCYITNMTIPLGEVFDFMIERHVSNVNKRVK